MAVRVKHATSLAPGLLTLSLLMNCAYAQQQPQPGAKRDDLDVTMQIIVDPDAKLPDEVVRRIPLPERKPASQSAPQSNAGAGDKSTEDRGSENKERGREAKALGRELGQELGQSAKDKAKEAAEQREQARRSAAEERRRRDPPGPPPNPPGRPPRP